VNDPWAALGEDPFGGGGTVRESVRHGDALLRAGSRVRIEPQGRADAFDMLLRGRAAVIESIEVDYEDRVHLALIVDDDPGADLGRLRQPGHRFFYLLDDVTPIGDSS
jgi:hypothetical protein